MNINDIINILPHKYPFLLIDKVLSINPPIDGKGESIDAIKNVTINEQFFIGHFPDHPIMPGVLIIEALAQAGIILVAHNFDKDFFSKKLVYFASIDSVKFKKPVIPGDVLCLHVEKTASKMGLWKMKGNASVNGENVTEVVFSAMLTDRNKP